MTTDPETTHVVVELKRILSEWYDTYGEPVPFDAAAIQCAIDEIMVLRAEADDQYAAGIARGRAEGLEEAAQKVAEYNDPEQVSVLVDAIRALKGKPRA